MSARSQPVPSRPPSSGSTPCLPTRARRFGRSLSPVRMHGACRCSSSLSGRLWLDRPSRRRLSRASFPSSPRTARAQQVEGRRRPVRPRLVRLSPARRRQARRLPVSPPAPRAVARASPPPARRAGGREPRLRRLPLRTGAAARLAIRRTSRSTRPRTRLRRSGLNGRDRLPHGPRHRRRRRSRRATRSPTSRSRPSLRSKRTRRRLCRTPARLRHRLQSPQATAMVAATVRATATATVRTRARSKPAGSGPVARATRRRVLRARRGRRTARRP
jgi:hypothetical protein